MAHIINNPHALYYNGELIGIITNPDPHGSICSIVESLSPDGGLAEARPMHPEGIAEAIRALPETIPVDSDDED